MDAALFLAVNGAGTPALDDAMWAVSELGKGEYATLIAFLLLSLAQRAVRPGALAAVALAALLAGGVTDVLKDHVARPRPLGALGGQVRVVGEELRWRSFPSGHSACAAALCVAAAGLVRTRRAWAVGAALAGLVMLSRVYVGAHYPGDVLGGALVGVCSGQVVLRAYAAVQRWRAGGARP